MRRMLRFRLKTFLILVLILGVGGGLYAQQQRVYDREQTAIRAMQGSMSGVVVKPQSEYEPLRSSFF